MEALKDATHFYEVERRVRVCAQGRVVGGRPHVPPPVRALRFGVAGLTVSVEAAIAATLPESRARLSVVVICISSVNGAAPGAGT